MSKRISETFVAVLILLYLMYTPLQSRFAMHIGNLDFKFGLLDISIALTNKMRIIGFGFLSIFLLHYMENSSLKYFKTFLGVMIFGLVIEITQIFFVDGHFRLRDLASDAVGIAVSFVLFKLLFDRRSDVGGKKLLFLNMTILVLQIIITMVIYYGFKEISILIGGEQLRKFL